MTDQMKIWALSNGGAGAVAQVRGLSAALAALIAAAVTEQTIPRGPPLHLLPAPAFTRGWIRHPLASVVAPGIVVACGARIAPAAIALRRRGAFVVFIQKPPFAARHFDLVVAPAHDRAAGANVIETIGAVGEVTKQSLELRRAAALRRFAHIPAPRIGALIGGGNRAFSLRPEDCPRLAHTLKSAAQAAGGGILATVSRRTGAAPAEILAQHLSGAHIFLHRGGAENPYLDILAAADFLLVSGDSVNMLSEACAAVKPVFIWMPPPRRGLRAQHAAQKFRSFHASLIARKLARPWRGVLEHWEAPGLHETARVAQEIQARFQEQKQRKLSIET